MGAAARAVAEGYSWSQAASEIEELYISLV
jgi:hypothetical protein